MKLKCDEIHTTSKYPAFTCELTEELDRIRGLNDKGDAWFYHHYIMCIVGYYYIRIPGNTVGGLWLDENNVITKWCVNDKDIYTEGLKTLRDYVGEKLVVDKGEDNVESEDYTGN